MNREGNSKQKWYSDKCQFESIWINDYNNMYAKRIRYGMLACVLVNVIKCKIDALSNNYAGL